MSTLNEIERLTAQVAAEVILSDSMRREIERLRGENAMLTMGLRAIIDDITGAELSKARAARAALEPGK